MSSASLSLRVHVSARAAILAGKAQIGVQSLELTDESLAQLAPAERAEVVLLFEGSEPELGTGPVDPPIVAPTLEGVRPVLLARAEQRKALDDARRKSDARAAEEAAVVARETAAKDGMRAKALRDWVTKNGDDEQKARMAEGFLHDEEILDAVTEELIDLSHPPYERLRRGDACECACAGHVVFVERAPTYMDSAQYARLTAVREDAPDGAIVEAVEHKAKCPACKCVPIARLAARVNLPWHGWLLVREYSID